MTEFWDKPAEKSGKVLEAFLEGLPLYETQYPTTNMASAGLFYIMQMERHLELYSERVTNGASWIRIDLAVQNPDPDPYAGLRIQIRI